MERSQGWQILRRVRDCARLMVGMPSYEDYLSHMAEHHPEATPLDFRAFFRDRQDARYGGKKGGPPRCC